MRVVVDYDPQMDKIEVMYYREEGGYLLINPSGIPV